MSEQPQKDVPPRKRARGEKTAEHIERRENELRTPGNVTPALMAHLARKFTPELIAQKIDELLVATHVTAGGKKIPDNRAREAGLKLLMSYIIGLPVQRQEIVTVKYDSLEELQAKARTSPALQAAVARVIQIDPPSTGED